MTQAIAIFVTTSTRHDAQVIAAAVVSQRLAACAQVSGPIESTFQWDGQQQTSEEWLVTIKTRDDMFPAVEAAILALHTYEQPEIIALPVVAASAGYLRWLEESLDRPSS
jgi:periplasmic divalent cation tolerance protein